MAIIGDTVKLRVEFRSFEGVLADPENIVLTVYDLNKTSLSGPVNINGDYKISTGIYEYPYTIPDNHPTLFYEFKGNAQGLPAAVRGLIVCNWR